MAITKIQSNAFPTTIDLSNVDLTLGAGEVLTANIADANVTTTKIADLAVETSKIADGHVTHAKPHTDMDLSGKTVTLPTLSNTLNISKSDQQIQTLISLEHQNQATFNIQGQSGSNDLGSENGTLLYNTAGSLGLRAGSTGDAELVITANGNVGIGETSPTQRLIVGNDSHGVAIDYIGAAYPRQAGIYTSSSAPVESAYGDLIIKARTDYGPNYSIGFVTAGSANAPALRARITSEGHFVPGANDTYDLGSISDVWRNIYTGDLHLSNEAKTEGNEVDGTKGNWTIQEGEEHLYIINNKSGKKYRFALEEIQ